MSRYYKFLAPFLAVALVFGLLALTGCQQPAEPTTPEAEEPAVDLKLVTPGQITVGSETSFPPFESMKGTVAEGFDVDLMNEIGKDLGLKVVFLSEGFDTLVPTLAAGGKFDVIASGMFISDERKKSIDFSEPYGVANQGIVVKSDSTVKSETDLNGKKIGVQSGTTGETWIKENTKGATLVPMKSATDQIAAVQAGNVDAAVNDFPVMSFLTKDPSSGLKVAKEAPTAELYGFGVSKDNPELLAAINTSLAKLKASGKLEELQVKWFGKAISN